MRRPWPVPLPLLAAACAAYAAAAALVSWTFTLSTGLSRWTMLPAGPQHTYANLLAINLATWLAWAALAPVVFTLGRHQRFERSGWLRPLVVHAVASIGFATLHGVFVASVRVTLQSLWGLEPRWWPSVVEHFFRNVDLHVPVYWGLLGLQHAVQYHREVRARDVAAAQVETRLVEAQLQALHRQVHPHFLFNTLHAISALVHRAPDKADLMIERLSDMLRVTLSPSASEEVPLRRELEFLQAYLAIEQVNFGTRLRVVQDVDPAVLDALVPSLVLQPLAENALRHGLAPLPRGGTLWVSARTDGAQLVLRVSDDGRGLVTHGETSGHGVGVSNTRARLEALHRQSATFSIRPRDGGGTDVVVRVPLRRTAADQRRRAS
jgi:two-component system, LytTR family, sensor kinase